MAAADQQPELDRRTFSESFDIPELKEVNGEVEETEGGATEKKGGTRRGHINRK